MGCIGPRALRSLTVELFHEKPSQFAIRPLDMREKKFNGRPVIPAGFETKPFDRQVKGLFHFGAGVLCTSRSVAGFSAAGNFSLPGKSMPRALARMPATVSGVTASPLGPAF